MTEDLKQLIDLVAGLPGAALWVLLGFAIYKLVTYLSVTGSIVFVLKLAIEKLHDWLTHTPPPREHVWRFDSQLGPMWMDGARTKVEVALADIGSKLCSKGGFVHASHADVIVKAINTALKESDDGQS